MSARKSENKVQQTPILEKENPEKGTSLKTSVQKQNTIQKSRKRISLNEFAIVNELRPEVKAGFKIWLKGDYFHFEEEWNKLFKEYTNRKLK